MNEQLTILMEVKKGRVHASSFLTVLGDMIDILEDVDASVSANRSGSVCWVITDATPSNPLTMTLEAEPKGEVNNGSEAIYYALTGIREMERTGDRPPMHFSPEALEKAKNISSVFSDGVERLILSSPGSEPVSVSQRLAANAADLLPKGHDELGTITGRLEGLSIHGRYSFCVWDVASNQKVDCLFTEDGYQEAHSLVGRRMDVSGRIHYSSAGIPLRVYVEETRLLPDHDTVSEVLDGPPLNITGGIDAVEYVRMIRDDD